MQDLNSHLHTLLTGVVHPDNQRQGLVGTTELEHIRVVRRPSADPPIYPEQPAPIRRHRTYHIALALAVALGIAVRAFHVPSQASRVNDGGLFFAMVRDLQAAHYHLPAFASYNGAGIPYAYSPLGFYLAGLLDDFTPLTLMDVFRWLPLAVSALTVVAFASLSQA